MQQTFRRADVKRVLGMTENQLNRAIIDGTVPPPAMIDGRETWWPGEIAAIRYGGTQVNWIARCATRRVPR